MVIRNRTLTLNGTNLSTRDLSFAGENHDVQVTVDESNWSKISECRQLVEKLADEKQCIYGINTSCGGLLDHLIPKEFEVDFQNNLIRAITTQVGEFFPDDLVRMFMISRANSLCRGYSGIKPENLKILVEMINKGVFPCVPMKGSLGASGDLGPLGCIACVAIGEWKASYKGKVMSGKKAMDLAGIPLMTLNAKEGLALINGTSAMSALASRVVSVAENTIKNSDIIAALSIETLKGRVNPFDVKIHEQKYHPGQYATAFNLRTLLKDSLLAIDEMEVSSNLTEVLKQNGGVSVAELLIEDAYSIRCTPQIVGPSREAVEFAKKVVARELNSSNDNPLIFTEHNSFVHNGNFHGQAISMAMDFVGTGMVNIGVLSDRRVDRFMDKNHSVGLPPFLCKENRGIRMGLMGAEFTTSSLVAENRTLAIPASIQSITSTADFQDVVSFGLIAARKANNIVENTNYILAFELLCAAQAANLRGIEKLSPAGRMLFDSVRETIPYLDYDVVITDYVEEIKSRIDIGDFVKRAEEVFGELMLVHDAEA